VNHDDVAVRYAPLKVLNERLRVLTEAPVEVPEPPTPTNQRVIDLRQPSIELPAATSP